MKVCKNCGELNTNDSSFCCNCGASYFVEKEEVVCPVCGTYNDKSFAFCINCGASLSSNGGAEADSSNTALQTSNCVQVSPSPFVEVTLPAAEIGKCPKCGAVVPLAASFCLQCGEKVTGVHEHRVVVEKVCPNCGKPNAQERADCAYCFYSLADAKRVEMQVVHEAVSVGDFAVEQAFLESESGKNAICPACGTLNSTDDFVCVNCGLKLAPDAAKKYCPNCGAENNFDSGFCSECHWSFDGIDPATSEKWHCEKCGHNNNYEDLYCSNCGAKKDNN